MSLGYEAMVSRLMQDYSVPREKAEAAARGQLGMPPTAPDPAIAEKDARILEKAEQAEIVKLFRAHGCKVYSLSQARASKQTPGIPDLWVTREPRPRCPALAWWWETKRQVGGKRSTAQVEFGDECHAAGVGYGFGDRHAAHDFLQHWIAISGGDRVELLER